MKKLLFYAALFFALPIFAQDHTEHDAASLDAMLAEAHVALEAGDTARAEELFAQVELLSVEQAATIGAIQEALDPDIAPDVVYARSYGKWSPTKAGECSKEIHDSYSAVNPRDGKTYPIWHPPVHPGRWWIPFDSCPFGHHHGFDPQTSDLFSKVGQPFFGEVAEIMSEQDEFGHRHEDHYGYKVFIKNDVIYTTAKDPITGLPLGRTLIGAVMNTFHMGTHSPDAFTNNQHEQQAAMEFFYQDTGEWASFNHVKLMTTAGKAGEIMQMCAPSPLIATGIAVPSDSPTAAPQNIGGSAGRRKMPTSACTVKPTTTDGNFAEVWEIGSTIASPFEILAPATTRLPERSYSPKRYAVGLRIHWYPNATMVSRYYDMATGLLGRSIDTCYMTNPDGTFLSRSGRCLDVRKVAPPETPMQWDDPLSPYQGGDIGLRLTTYQQNYPVGPVDYCTDVRALVGYPLNAAGGCDPGLVQQHTSNTDLRWTLNPARISVYTSTAELIHYKATEPTLHAPM